MFCRIKVYNLSLITICIGSLFAPVSSVICFGLPNARLNKVSNEYKEPFFNEVIIAFAIVFSSIVAFGLSQTLFNSSKSIAIIACMVSFISLNKNHPERVTIDTDIEFQHDEEKVKLNDYIIA